MINMQLLEITRNDIVNVSLVIMVFFIILGFVMNKLTGGFVFGYTKSHLSDKWKAYVLVFHCFGALAVGVILPNVVLDRFVYFQQLFEQDKTMIPISMVVGVVVLFLVFGVALSLLFRRKSGAK
ncbi:MAG: hypothetical protein ACI9EQ_001905 [Bacteroidia bacterium]|jgi:hypothetical protein